MQQSEAARESTKEGKKRAHRRFSDAVLSLSKAFALAAASDEAREIRDEVGFFQTVRAALAKSAPGAGKSSAERDLAVQQIVSRAVVSTEIVDILEAAGLETPDISILSDEFLAEVQGMEKKNLAMEALRKLLNGEIRSQTRVNVVQARTFSERLEEAIAPLPHERHHDDRGYSGADQPRQGHPVPRTDAARRKRSARRKSPSMTLWPRTRAQSRSWATTSCASSPTSC